MGGSLTQAPSYVLITEVGRVGDDSRGETSAFSLRRSQQYFVLLTRKSVTISCNTYHTGKNTATLPKVFILINGTIDFFYRHISASENKVVRI